MKGKYKTYFLKQKTICVFYIENNHVLYRIMVRFLIYTQHLWEQKPEKMAAQKNIDLT